MATARGTFIFSCRASHASVGLRGCPRTIGRSLPNLPQRAWSFSLPQRLPTTPMGARARLHSTGTARSPSSAGWPRPGPARGHIWSTRRVVLLTALTGALTYLYGARKYAAEWDGAPIRPKYGSAQDMEIVRVLASHSQGASKPLRMEPVSQSIGESESRIIQWCSQCF
jgi:hypothetical protein